jgi:transcriptional accessory protein Tex/SPT6
MSWTKRVRHPSEVVKKGDVVTVKVLEVNKENRRISLGIKQTVDDPWDDLAQEYTVGTILEGTVERLLDRGVVVELRTGVEGFVPVSHLLPDDIKKPAEYFGVGDRIPLKVIKIRRRIWRRSTPSSAPNGRCRRSRSRARSAARSNPTTTSTISTRSERRSPVTVPEGWALGAHPSA